MEQLELVCGVLWIDTDMLQTLTDSLDDGGRQVLDETIDELDVP